MTTHTFDLCDLLTLTVLLSPSALLRLGAAPYVNDLDLLTLTVLLSPSALLRLGAAPYVNDLDSLTLTVLLFVSLLSQPSLDSGCPLCQ